MWKCRVRYLGEQRSKGGHKGRSGWRLASGPAPESTGRSGLDVVAGPLPTHTVDNIGRMQRGGLEDEGTGTACSCSAVALKLVPPVLSY